MSVTAPLGFRAAGVTAGLKASGDRDVALVVNDGPSRRGRRVFTANRVKAAPVLWTRAGGQRRPGPRGRAQLRRRQRLHRARRASATPTPPPSRSAGALGIGAGEVAVCSTGLIGERLPMDSCCSPASTAACRRASADGGRSGRRRDQDHATPCRRRAVVARRAGYAIGGMAKGAGMLAPALATMLVRAHHRRGPDRRRPGRRAARAPARSRFDRLDSDGCMSTNDTVLLLASGASGVAPDAGRVRRAADRGVRRPGPAAAADAEGASKDDRDRGDRRGERGRRGRGRAGPSPAATCSSARSPARTRTGAGCWPRSAPPSAAFEPDALDVAINGVWVCRDGCAGEDRSHGRPVAAGTSRSPSTCPPARDTATIWTNDLTAAYVHENSAYST